VRHRVLLEGEFFSRNCHRSEFVHLRGVSSSGYLADGIGRTKAFPVKWTLPISGVNMNSVEEELEERDKPDQMRIACSSRKAGDNGQLVE